MENRDCWPKLSDSGASACILISKCIHPYLYKYFSEFLWYLAAYNVILVWMSHIPSWFLAGGTNNMSSLSTALNKWLPSLCFWTICFHISNNETVILFLSIVFVFSFLFFYSRLQRTELVSSWINNFRLVIWGWVLCCSRCFIIYFRYHRGKKREWILLKAIRGKLKARRFLSELFGQAIN